MSKASQPTRVLEFLKSEPNKKFTAREIAARIVDLYWEDYGAKMSRSGFIDKEQLIGQEIKLTGNLRTEFLLKTKILKTTLSLYLHIIKQEYLESATGIK